MQIGSTTSSTGPAAHGNTPASQTQGTHAGARAQGRTAAGTPGNADLFANLLLLLHAGSDLPADALAPTLDPSAEATDDASSALAQGRRTRRTSQPRLRSTSRALSMEMPAMEPSARCMLKGGSLSQRSDSPRVRRKRIDRCQRLPLTSWTCIDAEPSCRITRSTPALRTSEVTACGLAQGMDFPSSVAPFILRGVTLAGIDSVMAPRAVREAAWARLAQDLDTAQLERMTREVGLADAIGLGAEILAGQVRGRVVVNVNA